MHGQTGRLRKRPQKLTIEFVPQRKIDIRIESEIKKNVYDVVEQWTNWFEERRDRFSEILKSKKEDKVVLFVAGNSVPSPSKDGEELEQRFERWLAHSISEFFLPFESKSLWFCSWNSRLDRKRLPSGSFLRRVTENAIRRQWNDDPLFRRPSDWTRWVQARYVTGFPNDHPITQAAGKLSPERFAELLLSIAELIDENSEASPVDLAKELSIHFAINLGEYLTRPVIHVPVDLEHEQGRQVQQETPRYLNGTVEEIEIRKSELSSLTGRDLLKELKTVQEEKNAIDQHFTEWLAFSAVPLLAALENQIIESGGKSTKKLEVAMENLRLDAFAFLHIVDNAALAKSISKSERRAREISQEEGIGYELGKFRIHSKWEIDHFLTKDRPGPGRPPAGKVQD